MISVILSHLSGDVRQDGAVAGGCG
eukprot:COSAG02_NODE_36923_length_448_cov_20.174785_1_plen_24_part_10